MFDLNIVQLDQSVHTLAYISRQATWLVSAADTSQWAGLQITHFRITAMKLVVYAEVEQVLDADQPCPKKLDLEADYYFVNKIYNHSFS